MFPKKLMSIKHENQKGVISVPTGLFQTKDLSFSHYVCNRYHDLLMMSMNLSNMAILKIKNANHCFIIPGISKDEIIKPLQNIDLTEKS